MGTVWVTYATGTDWSVWGSDALQLTQFTQTHEVRNR